MNAARGSSTQNTLSEDRSHTIGELASAVGVNRKTIRYYEEVGLLPRPQRTASGYRLYSEPDRQRLAFIRRAKLVGFSLEEIKAILDASESGAPPCGKVLHLLDHKIETTTRELHALTAYYRRLIELRTSASRLVRRERPANSENACICGIIERAELGDVNPLPLDLPAHWQD